MQDTHVPPVALLMTATNIERYLSLVGVTVLCGKYDELVSNQDVQLLAGDPVSEIPLAWRALAETVGLIVDNAGRIVDGPRAYVPGLGSVVAYSTSGEQTWTPR